MGSPYPTKSTPLSDMGLVRKFVKYIKPYKRPLRAVYAMHLVNSVLNLLPALSLRFLFDMVIAPKPVSLLGYSVDTTPYMQTPRDKVIWTLAYLAGMTAIIVGANAIGVIMWRLGTRVTQRVLLDLKTHIMHHLHKLSLSYFHRERSGSVMTRAVGDVMQMEQMLMGSFHQTYALVQMLLAPALMFWMSPLLTLVALTPLPVFIWLTVRIRSRLRPLYRLQRERQEQVSAAIQEQLAGIREIKAFGQEREFQRDMREANVAYLRTVNEAMRVFSVNHQVLYGTKDLAMVLLAAAGAAIIALSLGEMSVGMIMAFLPLMTQFTNPVMGMTGYYDIFQRGMAATERVFNFLGVEPELQDKPGAKWVDIRQGRVTFEHVTFGYDPARPVLQDLSLDVQPGMKVALVGSTGSGKSTLVSLIPRFYEAQQGRILIDGLPVDRIQMDAIRRAIGIVFQETFLFYGTVAENIAFSNPHAGKSEIIRAAKLANIHDFVETLPQKYDTMLGERGVTLSGGQRQRVAIARMILKNPAIVILDEATSALDNETERLVKEGMDRLMQGRTAFVIAHRLSTIRNADLIVVMEQGRVVEQGTHEQLLSAGGHYARLAGAAD